MQIVTSYLESAARNMGFKEQLEVSSVREWLLARLIEDSMMRGMRRLKNMSK